MAVRRDSSAPGINPILSTRMLRRTVSLPNIMDFSEMQRLHGKLDGDLIQFHRNDNQTKSSADLASDCLARSNQPDLSAPNGRDLDSLTLKDLKEELEKRGLNKKGKKAELVHRLRSDIQKSRQKPPAAIETTDPPPGKPKCTTAEQCPCFPLISNLSSEIAEIRKIQMAEDKQTTQDSMNEIKRLEEQNESLRRHLVSLEGRCDRVTEERDSLKLALQLVSKDLIYCQSKNTDAPPSSAKVPPSTEPIVQPIVQPNNSNKRSDSHFVQQEPKSRSANEAVNDGWQTVKKAPTTRKKRDRQRKKTTGTAERVDESHHDSQPNHSTEGKQTTLIAGDSLLKNLQGWKLSRGHSVKVHTFPGCTTSDMFDYVKPLLRKQPSEIYLHVGTNSISQPHQTARSTAEEIVDLASYIEKESPSTELIISGLVTRTDVEGLPAKITEANKILQRFCRQNEWTFLPNDNIKSQHLNRSGLHLSREGTSQLARNLIDCMRRD